MLSGNNLGYYVSDCGGKIVGGYNILGKGAAAEKKYKLPAHKRVKF